MKRLFLIGSLVLVTSVFAALPGQKQAEQAMDNGKNASASEDASFDFSFSNLFKTPKQYSDVCGVNVNNQCFEVLNANGKAKIQTQNAGADIRLRIEHRAGCHFGYGFNIEGSFKGGVSVALRDNKTGELITTPVAVESDGDVKFEVDGKAYGDVSVVFLPFKVLNNTCNNGFSLDWHFKVAGSGSTSSTNANASGSASASAGASSDNGSVSMQCGGNGSGSSSTTGGSGSGSAQCSFKLKIGGDNKCVQIENPCDSNTTTYISQSDSFAIKPAHFRVHLPSHITQNIAVPVTLEVVDAKGNIIENYNNSSANLDVTFSPNVKAQYAFDIVNGKGSGTVKFLEPVNGVKMEVSDPHFADVDKDDTSSDNRTVDTDSSTSTNSDNSSSTTSDVSSHNPSKYWAGVGTNEPENNPTKNTIDSDIRQNTKKDLHYKKMGW